MLCYNRANSVEEAVRRGQRQVEQTRLKMGLQMDDKTFQVLLLDSQVLATKDQTKWNFDILQDLIEGPFLNPKRMEEAIKVSKFMRRLMSFFHPFSHRFSDIKKNMVNVQYLLSRILLSNLLGKHEMDQIRMYRPHDADGKRRWCTLPRRGG